MGKKKKSQPAVADPTQASPTTPSPLAMGKNGTVHIRISAKPGSKLSSITDFSQESVGVAISAPPVDGEANTHLLKYPSSVLGVRKSDLCLESGARSRCKVVSVQGLAMEEVELKMKAEINR